MNDDDCDASIRKVFMLSAIALVCVSWGFPLRSSWFNKVLGSDETLEGLLMRIRIFKGVLETLFGMSMLHVLASLIHTKCIVCFRLYPICRYSEPT